MTTYVTDEVRGLIGTRGEKQTATDPLSAHELRRFLQAVMDPGDWSADGLDFPPLYLLHVFRQERGTPDPADVLAENPSWDGLSVDGLGLPLPDLPLKRVLNGGTDAEFFQLPRVGDTISSQVHYADIAEREGRSGTMVLVTFETVYTNQDDALLARVRATLIMR